MANITQIFVEGDADAKFISDYILHIKPNMNAVKTPKKSEINIYNNEALIVAIHGLTGWTDIENMKSTITKYKNENDNVLVIFDADTNDNGGGFAKRKKQIYDYNLSIDGIFLFPNNQDDGTLEDLLENIITQTNKPIFDCWDKFENCLQENASKKIGKELITPAKKSKIYVYLESLLGKTQEEKKKIKDPFRDYSIVEHWNLNAEYLEPLKKFLIF